MCIDKLRSTISTNTRQIFKVITFIHYFSNPTHPHTSDSSWNAPLSTVVAAWYPPPLVPRNRFNCRHVLQCDNFAVCRLRCLTRSICINLLEVPSRVFVSSFEVTLKLILAKRMVAIDTSYATRKVISVALRISILVSQEVLQHRVPYSIFWGSTCRYSNMNDLKLSDIVQE
jgi:hypothetical protein